MTTRIRQFDPSTQELEIELPMPPSANRLHRSTRLGVHPSPEYADWLKRCAPYLAETLTGWEPDKTQWWDLMIWVHLGTAGGDGDNRVKALQDLLAGAYVTEKGDLGADGLPVSPGLVMKRGALFNDDSRVADLRVSVRTVNAQEPHIRVHARPGVAPTDERAVIRERAEQQRAEKAAVTAKAKADRLVETQKRREIQERKRQEKLAEKQARAAARQAAAPARRKAEG